MSGRSLVDLDRREFVVGLSAVVGSLAWGGCAAPATPLVRESLQGIIPPEQAWKVLGDYYLKNSRVSVHQVATDLARRVDWHKDLAPEELTQRLLAAMREDFWSGAVDGPDHWILAETELQVYAILSDAPLPDSEPGELETTGTA